MNRFSIFRSIVKKTDFSITLGTSHAEDLNKIANQIHLNNKKWWMDIQTGEPKKRNIGEMLMLIVTEIAEACEGDRKDLMDDHLPHRKMIEVELADAVIRIFDVSKGLGLDIGSAIVEKSNYNLTRADHQIENRRGQSGKKY